MLSVLRDQTYRHLFLAQMIALGGTGLATVALGLLAFELAGDRAGAVLGTALTIKMAAYVGVAPIAGALADRFPRRGFLVALDLFRAGIALALPFIDQIWQIYLLIFLLQSASAAFTPAFQATIPDILEDEKDYTNALSLSRLAYDLESLLSPLLAAALLSIVSFHWLFGGTSVGFLASAALVLSVALPRRKDAGRKAGFAEKATRGLRIFLKTPRLRGLLALDLCVASAGAMVIVNSVVYVRGLLGRPETDLAVALAIFGLGSMVAALSLPRLLERAADRLVMLSAAGILAAGLAALAAAMVAFPGWRWPALLIVWGVLGLGYSMVLTPVGRLLRRSSHTEDRPALFAAQFALSHACWLVTYPLAGWLGLAAGLPMTLAVLAVVAGLAALAAAALWPRSDPAVLAHRHRDLPPDHPHLREAGPDGRHAHAFVIDELHLRWPG